MNRIEVSVLWSLLGLFACSMGVPIPLTAEDEAPRKSADESSRKPDEAPPRKYSQTFEDEDLTDKDFSSKNLDNSNFRNANLTNTKFEGASLKNCDFNGAVLKGTTFTRADLTGSDFREATINTPTVYLGILNKVNLSDLDLSTVRLNGVKLRGAILRNAKAVGSIYEADFFEADLRGADFSNAYDQPPALFRKAKYDQFTRWHKGFVPKERGAVMTVTKADPEEAKKQKVSDTDPSATDKPGPEATFKKLDRNNDGVLSGKEMKGYKDRDENSDGDITLDEFLQKKE